MGHARRRHESEFGGFRSYRLRRLAVNGRLLVRCYRAPSRELTFDYHVHGRTHAVWAACSQHCMPNMIKLQLQALLVWSHC